jgi:hypothetical protein
VFFEQVSRSEKTIKQSCRVLGSNFTSAIFRPVTKDKLMGAWGYAPWNNDSAADWYGDLLDETALAAKVEEALNADPEEHANEIRAAAAVLIMLGRTFIWPIDDIDRHLALAIAKMEMVRSLHEDAPEFASAVAEEITVLKSRQANKKDGPVVPQPSTWGSFWA